MKRGKRTKKSIYSVLSYILVMIMLLGTVSPGFDVARASADETSVADNGSDLTAQKDVLAQQSGTQEQQSPEDDIDTEAPPEEPSLEEPQQEQEKDEEPKAEETEQQTGEDPKTEETEQPQDKETQEVTEEPLIEDIDKTNEEDNNQLMMQMFSSITTNTVVTENVTTSKIARPVSGKVNTWDITVRVEGQDSNTPQTTDIVLIIDRSGSMGWTDPGYNNTRMYYAKEAAKSFVDNMKAKDPAIKIAIVSYSSAGSGSSLYSINHGFANSQTATALKNSINSISPNGGTHTQAGIIAGRNLLNNSTADNKFIVLLSDGLPTYSYQPANWTQTPPSHWDIDSSRNRSFGIYDGLYGSNVRGTGASANGLLYGYSSIFSSYSYYVHHGDAAIKAGQDARQNIDGLFTIAVNAGTVGTPVLRDIASPGMNYSTNDLNELQEIYTRIGNQITTQYGLRNAVITDEMGDGFTLIDNTIVKTEGTTTVAPENQTNNQTITWKIEPHINALVPGSNDMRFAEMTYRVEINPDILNATPEVLNTNPEHNLFKTNKTTTLNYKNSGDTDRTVNIKSPEVDPVLLKIRKNLKDENGNVIIDESSSTRRFNVNISNGQATFHTENLLAGADYVTLTTLRDEGVYNVEELSITANPAESLNLYDISYSINGEETPEFLVNHIDEIPRGDVIINVTNRLKQPSGPDRNFIEVQKRFSGIEESQIPNDFKVIVTRGSEQYILTKGLNTDKVKFEISSDGLTWTWRIYDIGAGSYTVTENNETVDSYIIHTTGLGANQEVKPTTLNFTDIKLETENSKLTYSFGDGTSGIQFYAATLTQQAVAVITEKAMSAGDRIAIENAIRSKFGQGIWQRTYYFYSIEQQIQTGNSFELSGVTITYNENDKSMTFSSKSAWQHRATGKFDVDLAKNAEFEINNDYSQLIDVPITKIVTGNLGNLEGQFEFHVKVVDAVTGDKIIPLESGSEDLYDDELKLYTFTLSHNGGKTIEDLPKGAKLLLKEINPNGHIITVSSGQSPSTATYTPDGEGWYEILITSGISIQIENNKETEIYTGIYTNSIPYIATLTLAFVALSVIAIRKRQKNTNADRRYLDE